MASKAQRPSSFVVSLWDEHRNVAVISSCDRKFLAQLKQWAKSLGLRVEMPEKDES